jgi:hypothetical protein
VVHKMGRILYRWPTNPASNRQILRLGGCSRREYG